jgi:hypothetical protein
LPQPTCPSVTAQLQSATQLCAQARVPTALSSLPRTPKKQFQTKKQIKKFQDTKMWKMPKLLDGLLVSEILGIFAPTIFSLLQY